MRTFTGFQKGVNLGGWISQFAEYDEHLILESLNEPRLVGTKHEWGGLPSGIYINNSKNI